MMTLEQFSQYKLGIPEIDDDHWEMFKTIDTVLTNVHNKNYHTINSSLDYLMKEFARHINDEIRLMKEMNFPFIVTHQIEHKLLLHALMCEISNAKLGNYANLNFDIEQILINHIEQYDRLYADYARLMNRLTTTSEAQ